MCMGTHAAQDRAADAQATFTATLQSQAAHVFGADDTVWNSIQATAAPLFTAGPSQQGFSAAQQNSMNALALTQGANRGRFATASAKAGQAGFGGGNALNPSGVGTNVNASVAEQSAVETSRRLAQIQDENYKQGNQNWQVAGKM